jgi:hypothetical protein
VRSVTSSSLLYIKHSTYSRHADSILYPSPFLRLGLPVIDITNSTLKPPLLLSHCMAREEVRKANRATERETMRVRHTHAHTTNLLMMYAISHLLCLAALSLYYFRESLISVTAGNKTKQNKYIKIFFAFKGNNLIKTYSNFIILEKYPCFCLLKLGRHLSQVPCHV